MAKKKPFDHGKALEVGRREEIARQEQRRDDIRGALEHHKLVGGSDPQREFAVREANALSTMAQEAVQRGIVKPKDRWHALPQHMSKDPKMYRPLSVRESVRIAMQIHKAD